MTLSATTTEPGFSVDAFPVFYNLNFVSSVDFGLTWPAAWGSCIYTPCAGDDVEGDIVNPGDGVLHRWSECRQTWAVIPGYASFGPPDPPAQIALTTNPTTGSIGTTDCKGLRDLAILLAAAGVCGTPGDDPCSCGCPMEAQTWSSIKFLFRE